jgi:hypothetical protein
MNQMFWYFWCRCLDCCIICTMDTPHLICVTYYPLWFVMLPITLFETEMTTLSQDVAYRYTNLRSSRLS